MEKRNIVKNQKGFTLIEIIAVLVILGILAAVAVPKFLDMQQQARTKACDVAFAAAQSQAVMEYSEAVLATPNLAGTWTMTATSFVLGDYTVSIAVAATGIGTATITAAPEGVDAANYATFASGTDFVDTFQVYTP